MDTGKDIRIIRNVPEPEEEQPEGIPVPDWPVKVPEKVEADS